VVRQSYDTDWTENTDRTYPAIQPSRVLIRLREITNLESGKATTRSKRRITAAFEGTGPDTASPRGWFEGKVPLP
jgi:hypothetical protein